MTNPDVRSDVLAPALAPAVEAFLAAVARECADLSPADRARLLDGLAEHLAELSADGVDVVAELGDPAAYAAELRATAGLPPAPPRQVATAPVPVAPAGPAVVPSAPHPGSRRRFPAWGWVVAAVAAVGPVGVAVVVLGLAFLSSPSVEVATPVPPERTVAPQALVTVPDLTGMPLVQAREVLAAVGLEAQPRPQGAAFPDDARVLSQEPAPGSSTAPGSTVSLVLG